MKNSTKLTLLLAAMLSVSMGSVYAQSASGSDCESDAPLQGKAEAFKSLFTNSDGDSTVESTVGNNNAATGAAAEVSPGFTPYGYPNGYPKN